MIRIRRVYTNVLPADRRRIEQVQDIYRQNFSADAEYAEKIPTLLNAPVQAGFRSVLLAAETAMGRVDGFSLFFQFAEVRSALLDFIAVRRDIRGGGLGSALYEATREYCREAGARALYFEAQQDDPSRARTPGELEENRKRLRFYEHYGVRPIVNTAYETPIRPGGPAPFLLVDRLGRPEPLGRKECRAAVRQILMKKYGDLVDEAYIHKVAGSITDDPVRLRPHRYVKPGAEHQEVLPGRVEKPLAMIWSEVHRIHHVRERGYVERPARVTALRETLAETGLFNEIHAGPCGEEPIRAVHDGNFVSYLKQVCEKLEPKQPVYPYVFPLRRPHRRPKDLALRAGYYCIDTFTPLDRNAYRAARATVGVALAGAEELLRGRPAVYALCRPPGHHAERRVFGGFCYFNNAAIAAHRLAREGRVAMLDIDFHHGNGAQDIFWSRDDVLTISIHGHPNFAYPYFSGFADEAGEGAGRGVNRNFPLDEDVGDEVYLNTLDKALELVTRFRPQFLVVPLGFDTMRGDPTGSFALTTGAMRTIGQRLPATGIPLLLVQEGGYSLRNLRRGSRACFGGLAASLVERSG